MALRLMPRGPSMTSAVQAGRLAGVLLIEPEDLAREFEVRLADCSRLAVRVAYSVVRNQSEMGARLSFGNTAGVPRHFELGIMGEESLRASTVRWRSETALGVSFG